MRRRGFTLLEIVVVLALVGLMGAIAIPWFARSARQSRLSSLARELAAQVQVARSEATSRRQISAGPPPVVVRFAGIRIDSATRYTVFADADADPANGEIDVDIVDWLARAPNTHARIVQPAPGSRIRFRQDGTTTAVIVLIDDVGLGQRREVRINGVGQATVVSAMQ